MHFHLYCLDTFHGVGRSSADWDKCNAVRLHVCGMATELLIVFQLLRLRRKLSFCILKGFFLMETCRFASARSLNPGLRDDNISEPLLPEPKPRSISRLRGGSSDKDLALLARLPVPSN